MAVAVFGGCVTASSVRPDKPRAIWAARSQAAPATEVNFDGHDGIVDSAPLVPFALYAIDQDMVEGTRVWLPKGALLMQMAGGAGNWFCTWRFDDKANQSEAEATHGTLDTIEYLLCLQADANGRTTNPKVMIAHTKGIMIVDDPDSGMWKYRNGVGDTNAVTLLPAASDALPKRMQLRVSAAWTSSGGGSVCFHADIADMTGRVVMKQEEQCIAGVGQSVTVAGGRYTIAAMGGRNNFRIRIDHPIDVRHMIPDVVRYAYR